MGDANPPLPTSATKVKKAHSTATPEAPAINIQKYETRTWRNAFVHYAVDWNETIQIADTKYIAYGGGPG
ncbi:hypothetical protein COL69_28965, partial [Bacillus pseudomycoides]